MTAVPRTPIAPEPTRSLLSHWATARSRTKILSTVGVAPSSAATIGGLSIVGMSPASADADELYSSNLMGAVEVAPPGEPRCTRCAWSPGTRPRADRERQQERFARPWSCVRSSGHRRRVPSNRDEPRPGGDARPHRRRAARPTSPSRTACCAPLAVTATSTAWLAANDAQGTPVVDELRADVTALDELETEAARGRRRRAGQRGRQPDHDDRVAIGGILRAVLLGWAVAGGIARGVRRVQHVAEALAAGDLTRTTGVTSHDELGRMAGALDAAQANLRAVLAGVAASADAVAASSEELSASSAQISASAEETSAQSGVSSPAPPRRSAAACRPSPRAPSRWVPRSGRSPRNAAEASEVAARAVTAAETTTATVAKLGESSAEIGNVVKVITSHRRADEPAGAERHDRGRPGR